MKHLFQTFVLNTHILIISLVIAALGVGVLSTSKSSLQTQGEQTTQTSSKPSTPTTGPQPRSVPPNLRSESAASSQTANQNSVVATSGSGTSSSDNVVSSPPTTAPTVEPVIPPTCDSTCNPTPTPSPTPVGSCGGCGTSYYRKPQIVCPMYCVDSPAN